MRGFFAIPHLILFLLLLGGCASAPKTPPPEGEISVLLRSTPDGNPEKEVLAWMNQFTRKERDSFYRTLKRSESYRPMVQSLLADSRLPPELSYLAFIESSYVNQATSKTSAAGLWQFMAPTGRSFGLQIQSDRDERRHPIASTEAACRYLRQLRERLGSWPLAIAAYNAGEARIRTAIRKGKTRDFWKLSAKKLLPRETSRYVPKFLAAAEIGSHPVDFGFRKFDPDTLWPRLVRVRLRMGSGPKMLARWLGVPESELLKYNPSLSHPETRRHVKRDGVLLWIPESAKPMASSR